MVRGETSHLPSAPRADEHAICYYFAIPHAWFS
jgi:hypothetical protein